MPHGDHDPNLTVGLLTSDKANRFCSFHNETVRALADLLATSGHTHPDDIERDHIYKRTSTNRIVRYDKIYPPVELGLLDSNVPACYRCYFTETQTSSIEPLAV